MDLLNRLTDAELLGRTASQPKAFGVFYCRHERLVLRFLNSRCRDAELTPVRAKGTSAIPWLLGIAHHTLVSSIRRGVVADDARRRLGSTPLALSDDALARVELRAGFDVPVEQLIRGLQDDLRDAVIARVLEERDYGEIAAQLGCSQQVVRKRVSRGLGRLRTALLSANQ